MKTADFILIIVIKMSIETIDQLHVWERAICSLQRYNH